MWPTYSNAEALPQVPSELPSKHYDAALLRECKEHCDTSGMTQDTVLLVIEQCMAEAEACAKRHNGLVRAILAP